MQFNLFHDTLINNLCFLGGRVNILYDRVIAGRILIFIMIEVHYNS